MAALVEAAQAPDFPAEIVGVISDRPDATGLAFAAERGIPTMVLERSAFASKDAHDQAIDATLHGLGTEIVCLAGYMRLLTQTFVAEWQGRMINIHPSLLPLFKGLDTHRRAIESGMRVHGCTVHFVTHAMDDGPVIAQAAVPIALDDTPETLSARLLRVEHRLYPLALSLVATGKAKMQEGRTVFEPGAAAVAADASLLSPASTQQDVDLEALARFTP
jgi:formyltetrahydrofolate-dependent phosphoribosylglycinamide formyltransferase